MSDNAPLNDITQFAARSLLLNDSPQSSLRGLENHDESLLVSVLHTRTFVATFNMECVYFFGGKTYNRVKHAKNINN